MVLHRLLGEPELVTDLTVGQAVTDQFENLLLGGGERVGRVGVGGLTTGEGPLVEQVATRGDGPDDLRDLRPRTVFSTKAAAPASRAAATASSSSNEVRTTQRRAGCSPRRRRTRSMPVPSGSLRSTTATSGRTAAALRTASRTDPASATTVSVGSASTTSTTPRRTISWSSTTRTLICASATGTGYRANDPKGRPGSRAGHRRHYQGLWRSRGWPFRHASEPRLTEVVGCSR